MRRAREIGRELHEIGGFDLMRRVMRALMERRPVGYELVSAWWDGVGKWRY